MTLKSHPCGSASAPWLPPPPPQDAGGSPSQSWLFHLGSGKWGCVERLEILPVGRRAALKDTEGGLGLQLCQDWLLSTAGCFHCPDEETQAGISSLPILGSQWIPRNLTFWLVFFSQWIWPYQKGPSWCNILRIKFLLFSMPRGIKGTRGL